MKNKLIRDLEVKKKFKMYKAEKHWVIAPIIFLGIASMSMVGNTYAEANSSKTEVSISNSENHKGSLQVPDDKKMNTINSETYVQKNEEASQKLLMFKQEKKKQLKQIIGLTDEQIRIFTSSIDEATTEATIKAIIDDAEKQATENNKEKIKLSEKTKNENDQARKQEDAKQKIESQVTASQSTKVGNNLNENIRINNFSNANPEYSHDEFDPSKEGGRVLPTIGLNPPVIKSLGYKADKLYIKLSHSSGEKFNEVNKVYSVDITFGSEVLPQFKNYGQYYDIGYDETRYEYYIQVTGRLAEILNNPQNINENSKFTFVVIYRAIDRINIIKSQPVTVKLTNKDVLEYNLSEVADRINNEIENDNSLTTEEKAEQKEKVKQEFEKGKNNILNSTNDAEANNKYNEAVINIERAHTTGTAKKIAKAEIDAEAKKVKDEIDTDGTLTAEEKEKQKAGVDQEAEKARGAIDGAKDIDGVNQGKADGIKAIDDQHKPGDPVDNRKEQAKADIDKEAKKVKDEIDTDGTLTAEEKEKQKAGVDQEAEKAKGAIDGAKDIDGVNQGKADGIKAIDDQHKPGDPVDNRKEQAKADIDKEAKKVKDEIDTDGTLTA
ncbi:DUF1542 domain-containing protein, partial [Melissococcus plutonius]|uniref:DUF1542 domain-containing protein n=4 Tax=Melissococcus plutonius TaxID=33970 RepID=UPI003C3041F6